MQISRRDLFKTGAVVGGALAFRGILSPGIAEAAVTGSRALAATSFDTVLLRGDANESGWRPIVTGPGEPHLVRPGLGTKALAGREATRQGLLAFVQLSDVHICDHQSPMRFESQDPNISSSAYRPQEMLTAHIAESMVREINAVAAGPVTGLPLAHAVQTGDNSDNGQYNEIRWNIDILDGGEIRPDSGDLTKYEGVMNVDWDPDKSTYPNFWHPEIAAAADSKYATFPAVPGLLDAARQPFQATGLAMKWYTAMGNHDPLVQGNFPKSPSFNAIATGTKKAGHTVTADPNRKMISHKEWVDEHFTTTKEPAGHGFTAQNKAKGTAYYTFDDDQGGAVRFIVLDTTNPNGLQHGSLDKAQFAWLQAQLKKATTDKKLVVLASHHTISTMRKKDAPSQGIKDRVFGQTVRKELIKHQNVILWVNGHTHTNHIWPHPATKNGKPTGRGFWEVNTASHIDWPQQSRIVEIVDNGDGTLSIFATMLDHGAPLEFSGDLTDPMQLAALGRELAANDWQEQSHDRRGDVNARNVELIVKAPSFLA
ncbi:metallophosphoesterase [Nocardioides sp. CN2-186]|uniref:metallophosphoesterase n=1 Tax=Nocardioides tweenelious TaxID=3156607 RepID=UPI0032B5D458